jgi:A/G-specific adenine glycosylase
MLQQTPVVRVRPAYDAWLTRWPVPAALADDPPGAALRMWGNLGYPRRALRLHECARTLVERFGGGVPADVDTLLTLPGVGAYTARAVAVFAFGQRHPVVDTNVRRVTARLILGQGQAGPPATAQDLATVEAILPRDAQIARQASVALMELGALLCTARAPACQPCPVRDECAWRQAGAPPYPGPVTRSQRFIGTDRQVRGRLMDVLRANRTPVPLAGFDAGWPVTGQRDRALGTLIEDGLVELLADGRYALPGE